MNRVEEERIKLLLFSIVDDIFSCFEPNQYTTGVKVSIKNRIVDTDLLHTPAACATVKKKLTVRAEGVPENSGHQ